MAHLAVCAPAWPQAVGLDPAALSGEWVVAYATTLPAPGSSTMGAPAASSEAETGLLGYLIHLLAALPGWGLESVSQHLVPDPTGVSGKLLLVNSATFSLGLLGVWRVELHGTWQTAQGGMASQTFDSLMLRPLSMLGQSTTALPPVRGLYSCIRPRASDVRHVSTILPSDARLQVCVELPPQMRSVSDWSTTYVDVDTRITRGPAGVAFLLTRPPISSSDSAAAQAALQSNAVGQWGPVITVGGV